MNVIRTLVSISCALPITLILAACGGGGGGSSVLPPTQLTALSNGNGKGNGNGVGNGKPTTTTSPSPTPAGASPAPGSTATPVPGSPPTAAPTPVPLPPGTVPSHIPTWAYDQYNAEGAAASTSQVQQYVTYAEGGLGNNKAVTDCSGSGSCHSVWYVDTNKVYDSSVCPNQVDAQFVAASAESWYVHESGFSDFAHRVQGTYPVSCSKGSQNEPVYIPNNSSTAVENYFNTYLQANANNWDYYMMDDTAGTVIDQMYGSSGGFCGGAYCTTTQELPTDASVVQSHAAMANALNHTNGSPMMFFYNGLGFDGAQQANDVDVLQSSNRFVGAICENCIVGANTLKPQMYAPVLNTMATIDNTTSGAFVLLSTGNAAAGSSTQVAGRAVTTAIIWLGYKDGHTVVWPNLEYNTTNLAVWPEDQIYPSQALESMSSGASDLQVAPGVWRREFAQCYQNGVAIGACAAILNANGSAVTVQAAWLQKTYNHSVQMLGGDILSGGSLALMSLNFTVNVTTVPANQALLLAQ